MTPRLAWLLAPVLAACTSSSPSTDIDSTPLSGSVGGQPWTIMAGATDPFGSQDQPDFSATLSPAAFACNDSDPTVPHLFVSIPRQPGDYPMSLSRNMTFVDSAAHNLIVVDGRIVVDSVTATTVTGGLVGRYDGSNEVNGRFTLTVCPNQP